MNLYIPRKLIDQTAEILGLADRPEAEQQKFGIKEIYRQCRRLYDVYQDKSTATRRRSRSAFYWNQVDTFALYSLISCQYLSKSAINRALKDLAATEAALDKLKVDELAVYNQFSMFLESLTESPRKLNLTKFKARLVDWGNRYNDDQLYFLIRVINAALSAKAESPMLERSVADAMKRVKAASHKVIQQRFKERMEYILAQLQLMLKAKQEGTFSEFVSTMVAPSRAATAPTNDDMDEKAGVEIKKVKQVKQRKSTKPEASMTPEPDPQQATDELSPAVPASDEAPSAIKASEMLRPATIL